MATDIWCTLGPASLNDRVIARLEELGVSLFRLNLSHTRVEDLPAILDFIRSRTRVPVSLDTEGAQIRTAELVAGKDGVGADWHPSAATHAKMAEKLVATLKQDLGW